MISSPYNGILVVDKPTDWTSHDVVQKTRNLLGGCKVGHTGTLDPFATGVLILLIGDATKEAVRFSDDIKVYDAEVTFGSSTDTYDLTGTIVDTGNAASVDLEKLDQVVSGFQGESYQSPPMYSARKVGGIRLYKYARKGKTVTVEPRLITVHNIAAQYNRFPVIQISVTCSKGTYIRSLAHDIGQMVGCPAHLSALRRIRAGNYTIDDALDFKAVVDSGDFSLLKNSIRSIGEV